MSKAAKRMEQLMKALLDGKQPETEEEQEIYDMLVHLGLLGGGSEAPAEESIAGSPGPEETTLEEEGDKSTVIIPCGEEYGDHPLR